MRRLFALLLLPIAAVVVLLPAPSAHAVAPPVVATQAQLPEDFVGVTPGDPNATGNAFAPEEYEPNFLWGAAVGLTVLVLGGVGLVGALYWSMVLKPRQEQAA